MRSDFTEELVRAKSHLKSLKQALRNNSGGKTMDFFLQELGREINTLSDKSGQVSVSRFAVKIKAELEKLREQALNIE